MVNHAYEAIDSADHDGAGMSVDLDDARPDVLLITFIDDQETVTGSLYIKPEDARGFATALRYYADRVKPTPAFGTRS